MDGALLAIRYAREHALPFLGTCGGLAWVAPFLGIPTVAVYDTDAMLAPHLLLARRAGHDAGAAEFAPFDLRAADRVRLLATPRPV